MSQMWHPSSGRASVPYPCLEAAVAASKRGESEHAVGDRGVISGIRSSNKWRHHPSLLRHSNRGSSRTPCCSAAALRCKKQQDKPGVALAR
eukprot:351625-Chlamydomonas_euryale.AAC.4